MIDGNGVFGECIFWLIIIVVFDVFFGVDMVIDIFVYIVCCVSFND